MPGVSVADIDVEIARLQKLRLEQEKAEMEENRVKYHEEARALIQQLREVLDRLNELGYLPPQLQRALVDKEGKYNPGMYIKSPRALSQDSDS